MTPLAQNLLNAADSLPLPPMKSYAGIIALIKRTAVVVNSQQEQIERLYKNADVVRIPHDGFCK